MTFSKESIISNIDFSNITFASAPFQMPSNSSQSSNQMVSPQNQSISIHNSTPNTYFKWNGKHPKTQLPSSNDVYFNLVSKEQIQKYNEKHKSEGKTKDSFSLYTEYLPSHHFDISNIPLILTSMNTYNNYDISEILRSDKSRLFFDIDIDTNDYLDSEFELTWNQIRQIMNILQIPINNIHGFAECSFTFIKDNIPDDIHQNITFLNNPYNSKDFSAHLYVYDYYFDRDTIFDLFSQGKNQFNRSPKTLSHLSKYIDLSVYVSAGSQKVFRFGLSAKLNKGRPHPEFDEGILGNTITSFNYYVCNKTSLDTNFISVKDERITNLKNYLSTLSAKTTCKEKIPKKPANKIQELMEEQINESQQESYKYIAKHSVHAQWYHSLIQEMRRYLISNSNASDEDLFNYFSQEQYQYFSNSNNKRLYQPSSINSAIRVVREKPRISISELFESHFEEIVPKQEAQCSSQVFKYSLEHFKKIINSSYALEYPKVAELIHYTFVFYTRLTKQKNSTLFISFLDGSTNKIVNIEYAKFVQSLETSPIKIRVQLHQGGIINVKLPTAFNMFDKYKTKFYDFCLYSLDKSLLSLFNPAPIKPFAELPQAIKEILNIIATESDNSINQDKINYILDWLAYIIQHPESRNSTALQISTLQGIGKNILSNAICAYIGEEFSLANTNINNIIGTYNGNVAEKLFIVVNEVDTTKKDSDRLKSVITDNEVDVNVKYGAQYITKNTASYLFFTNHLDTNTISNGDRRFTFIKSYGLPKPKSFYKSICVPGSDSMLLPEIQQQFIGYLKNRDISNYNPCDDVEFDKQLIYDQRESGRSVLYQVLKIILTNLYIRYNQDCILQNDFINLINYVASNQLQIPNQENPFNGTPITLAQYLNMPDLEGFDDSIKEEFGKSKLTDKALTNILKYEDDKEIEKLKSKKRDNTRDKQILRLRNPTLIKIPTPTETSETIETIDI